MVEEFGSTCPLDCPGACALRVKVTGSRVLEVSGDPDHPFTQGVICGKVARYPRRQEGARVLQPLLRDGPKGSGRFRVIGWDEALDRAVEGLATVTARHGAEAVLPFSYGGTMGVLQRGAIERLTHRAGYTRLERTICYPIGYAGWRAGVGAALGPDPASLADSDLVILWGINAVSTHLNLMTFVKRARARGAKLVVVDPYRNRTARLADLHLDPRPGSDGALAVAMMQVLLAEGLADRAYLARWTDFDPAVEAHLATRTPEWAAPITGLDPERIRTLARLYGRARAPFIRVGLGMSRQTNGAVNVHAVACLPALAGAWQHAGSGALFATGGAFTLNEAPVRRPDWAAARPSRSLDMCQLGEHLTRPHQPVMALLVQGANPAVSCPDLGRVRQGLQREELFTVVHEQVMTDTARHADLVLPATTFLEHEDLYKSYGQYTLQHAPAVTTPRGEARSNHDLINALAHGLGFDDPPFQMSSGELLAELLAASNLPPRSQWPHRWLEVTPSPARQRFQDGFPQPDGRFHFRPGWSDPALPALPDHWPVNARDQAGAEDYPLDLITPPAHTLLNSTFNEAERRGAPLLWLHPEDAGRRGIREGQAVLVGNARGEVTLTARLTDEVRPGLCVCETNRSWEAFPEGVSINLLTSPQRVTPDGGAAFHDNRVQVRPAQPPMTPDANAAAAPAENATSAAGPD